MTGKPKGNIWMKTRVQAIPVIFLCQQQDHMVRNALRDLTPDAVIVDPRFREPGIDQFHIPAANGEQLAVFQGTQVIGLIFRTIIKIIGQHHERIFTEETGNQLLRPRIVVVQFKKSPADEMQVMGILAGQQYQCTLFDRAVNKRIIRFNKLLVAHAYRMERAQNVDELAF